MLQPDQVLIPTTLYEYLEKVLLPLKKARNQAWGDYVSGWIRSSAEAEYRQLAIREQYKGNTDQQVARLLCELAIALAINNWHRMKDEPPPVPEMKNIDSLF